VDFSIIHRVTPSHRGVSSTTGRSPGFRSSPAAAFPANTGGANAAAPGNSGGTAQVLHLIPYSPFKGTC